MHQTVDDAIALDRADPRNRIDVHVVETRSPFTPELRCTITVTRPRRVKVTRQRHDILCTREELGQLIRTLRDAYVQLGGR